MITSPEGIVEYVNPAYCRITGFAEAECVGAMSRILSGENLPRALVEEVWSKLNRGEVWSGYLSDRRKNHDQYQVEATFSPVRDANGRIVNFVIVKRDVTGERDLEAQLRQAQKMESIGRLAGGVAHDFNNLLMGIMLFADLALKNIEPGSPLHAHLGEIRKAGASATELIRKLMTISRRQAIDVRPVDLNEIVSGMVSILKRVIGEDVQLSCRLSEDLRPINAADEQIRQILMNLAVNARDAMPDGGRIEVTSQNVFVDAETARRHALTTVGWYALLTVRDTGCGIPEEALDHIYEPFFTTKSRDKGTGLGLSTVYSIMQQHNGLVLCDSAVGRGTTFRLYLPQSDLGADANRAVEAGNEATGGHETILLVEDEPLARHMLVEILTSLGYQVLEAADGQRALHLAARLEQPVDLLVTDVVMPGLSGPQVYQRLKESWPGLKVLLISGYSNERFDAKLRREWVGEILAKPFSMSALAERVRQLLDAPLPMR